jgi:glycosyltransferase involved in cell wall biosynthesis
MRFLMLNWRDPKNPKSGGAERVSYAYLRGLIDRGHSVSWFANTFDGAPAGETVDGIEVIRGGGKGSSVWKALRWFKKNKPFDLVIDQHHGLPWFAPWWGQTNCVAYIHEVLGPIWSAFYRWPLSTIGRWQERRVLALYRDVRFWTPSESTRQILAQYGVKHVKVLPNGTDATPLPYLEDKPLSSPLRMVAVSRLAPNKRVDHLIDATAILLKRGLHATLTVVGAGEVELKLRIRAKSLSLEDNIRFTGALSEAQKNQELRNAHFLVHASLREGWGLNVIEANAMGTPAVVYPVGGLVDSTVDGQTGLVSRHETPESLAETLWNAARLVKQYDAMRILAWERSKRFVWPAVLPLACDWLEQQAIGNK